MTGDRFSPILRAPPAGFYPWSFLEAAALAATLPLPLPQPQTIQECLFPTVSLGSERNAARFKRLFICRRSQKQQSRGRHTCVPRLGKPTTAWRKPPDSTCTLPGHQLSPPLVLSYCSLLGTAPLRKSVKAGRLYPAHWFLRLWLWLEHSATL